MLVKNKETGTRGTMNLPFLFNETDSLKARETEAFVGIKTRRPSDQPRMTVGQPTPYAIVLDNKRVEKNKNAEETSRLAVDQRHHQKWSAVSVAGQNKRQGEWKRNGLRHKA